MKAVFLTGIREVQLRQAPRPELGSDRDVLLRIDTVGVCGSDMHYYRNGRIGNQVIQYPWIIGHECAGTVVEAGPASPLKPGRRVAIDPLVWCGKCDQCKAGRFHTCRNQGFLGCPGQLPGALAEYLVMPADSCYPVPEAMTPEQIVMAEPLSIALWSVAQAGKTAGLRIGVLGSGPIGLCVLLALKAAGPCTVYQTDLLDNRLELARRLGADWTANADRQDVDAALAELEPLGLDLVIEAVGKEETINQGMRLLKPGGTLVITGIPFEDTISFNMNQMRRKELRIQNVRRQNECVQPAIDLIAGGKVNVDAMVTHHFSLAQTQEAFDMAADYADGIVKGMIRI